MAKLYYYNKAKKRRQCSSCFDIKSFNDFGSNGRGGKRSDCKKCHSDYNNNAEKLKKKKVRRKNNNPKTLAPGPKR